MAFALSKSKYCSAVQCPKMLWMKKNMPEEFDDSVMNQSVLDTGNEVGDLAMGLFGDFVEVPFDLGIPGMLHRTKELIEAGTPIIAEASFSCDGLFCSVDILKNLGNRTVEIYEVKSSTEIHDIYLSDVAYQYYVLAALGYHVQKVCLVYINSKYVRMGDLELDKLFAIEDVTAIALSKRAEVENKIIELREYMKQSDEPSDEIGMHCFEPYECGFFKHCTRKLPKPNVFDVHGLQKKKMFECYDDGIVSFENLSNCDRLSAKQHMQVEYQLSHYPPHIEKGAIRAFLDTLSYPMYFLDFETFQPAVPLYDNSRPYQQITFQYSLHYIEEEGGELKHREYLAYPGEDPRRKLAEQLCGDIPKDTCVMAYNMGFEMGRIKEMSAIYPDLAEHLLNIRENIVDLMVPFRDKAYYCEAMQGSYSIKYVLPALFPDDPTLDYHNLEEVHHGGEASNLFRRMANMDAQTLERSRKNLLKYCWLDTYAMVKVWEKLCDVAG